MDPNSYLQTGIDSTDILNLQQDTQERFNKLFQNPELPSLQSQMPDVTLGKAGIVNSGDNINQKSVEDLYGQMTKNTIKSGSNELLFDADNFLPQKETEKYLDEKYGYTYGLDNEDWYARNQSGWERTGKGIIGFVTKTLGNVVKTGGFALGLVNPYNWDKNYIGNVSDNLIVKATQSVEDKILQDWLPQYQEASDRGKGIIWRMFHDGNFWSEDFVDLAAFMTSAYITGGGAVGLKLGSKLAPLLTGIKELKTAEGFLTAAGRTANTIDRIAATSINTIGEAMFEAKGVRDKVYEELIKQGVDEDTAKKKSSDAGEQTFFGNIALLSFSSYWEAGIFYKRLRNESKSALKLGENTIVDDIALKSPSKFEKLFDNPFTFSLKKAGEGFTVEGLYEENGQLAVSRNAEKEYSSKDGYKQIGFLGSIVNVFSQWYKQTIDAYKGKDEEAFENIFLGGLTGSAMGGVGSFINKDYAQKKNDAIKLVAELNAAKAAWLKRSDIYDIDQDGNVKLNEQKLLGSLYGNIQAGIKQNLADYYKDDINKEIVRKEAFASYALAHFKAGSKDKLLDEIQTIGKLTPEQIVRMGLDPKVENIVQKQSEYTNFALKLKDAYDAIEKHYKYDGADPNVDLYRRNYLFELQGKQVALRDQASIIQSNLDSLNSKIPHGSLSDNIVDEANFINSKIIIQKNNVNSFQDKIAAEKILKKLQSQKEKLEKNNEELFGKLKQDAGRYYFYENQDKNGELLIKDYQEGLVKKAVMENQADNLKSVFDKYSDKAKGYNAFYEEIVKPQADELLKAQEEIAKREETKQEVEQQEEKPQQKNSEFNRKYYLSELANTSNSHSVKAHITDVEGYEDFIRELDPNFDIKDVNLKFLKENAQKELDKLVGTGRQDIPPKPEKTEAHNIIGLINSTDPINEENHKYFLDKINKSLGENKIIQSEYDSIKKLIDKKLELYNIDSDLEKNTSEDNNKEQNVNVTIDSQGEFNPDAEDDIDPSEKEESVESLLSYKTSNKTVTQEEKEDNNGTYTGKLDEDSYKQFKQNFIRNQLSYEGALFDYGGKIIKDNPAIPKEKATEEVLKRDPSKLGSVLVLTDKIGNTLYFDKNYTKSVEPKEGYLPIAFSFTDTYWAKDQDFRALIGQARTQGQISVEQWLQQYENEAKQRTTARKMNDLGISLPVSLTGFNQGVMPYSKVSKPLIEVILGKSVSFIIPGSKEAATGEKFTYVNGQKLIKGGFYVGINGKYFRAKPKKITDVKYEGLEDLHDYFTNAILSNFNKQEDAQFVLNFLSKVLFINRQGRPEFKIYTQEEGFKIKPILNGKAMTLSEFDEWFNKQYLNIHSDSLGQKLNVPIFAEGEVGHKTINYNSFITANTETNAQGIQTSKGLQFIPLNGFLTFEFNSSLESMEAQVASTQTIQPFEEIRPAPETEVEDKYHTDTEIAAIKYLKKDLEERRQEELAKLDKGLKKGDKVWVIKKSREDELLKDHPNLWSQEGSDKILIPSDFTQGTVTNESDPESGEFQLTGSDIEAPAGGLWNIYIEKIITNLKYDAELAALNINKSVTKENIEKRRNKSIEEIGEAKKGSTGKYVGYYEHPNGKEDSIYGNDKERIINKLNEKYNKELNDLGLVSNDSSITGDEIKPKFQEFDINDQSASDIQAEIEKFKKDNRLERSKQDYIGDLLSVQEIDDVRRMFNNQVNINHLQDVVDANAWATWTSAGITLYKDAVQGTGYHEAWHQFSQLYLTKREKKSLYNEARGKVELLKNAPDFIVEEYIAEDFRKFVTSEGKSRLNDRPDRNSIFRKILDFLKRFFFGSINIDKLYNQLYRGQLKDYKPNINNALFGKLNSKIINPATGLEVLDNTKAGYYTSVIDVLLGQSLLDNNASPATMNSNLKLASYFYNNVKNDLIKNYYNPQLEKFTKGEPANEQLLEDLQKILSNWNAVIEYHKEHSKLGVLIEDDIPEVEENYNPTEDLENPDLEEHKEAEFAGDKQIFDRKGNEQSSMESASEEIRGIIRMLPEVEPFFDGQKYAYRVKKDLNGFPKLTEYSKTWNNIAIELAGDISYVRMYWKIQQPDFLDKIPEAAELIKRIPNPSNIMSPEQRNTAIKFAQAFSKSYVPINSLLKDGDRYLLVEETNRNRDAIQKQWTSNFMSHDEASDYALQGLILIDENGRNYINKDSRFNYKFNTPEEIDFFLNFLGINMSQRSKKDNRYKKDIVAYVKAIQNTLNQRLSNNMTISDPISDLGRDYETLEEKPLPGVRRIMNALLNIESKYSSVNPSMSYQTADGEVIYGLSFNNTLTLHSYFLNSARTLQELYSRPETLHLNPSVNPYVRNSVYLNALFDFETGNKRLDKYGNEIKLFVNNYNGTKEIGAEGTKGKSTANLNAREKMVMDLNSLLVSGLDEIMRTESSSSAWAIGLSAYDSYSDKKLPISIENFERGFTSELTNIWKGYIYDELFRIKNADSVILPNYPREAAKEFNLNYDILTPTLKDKLKLELSTNEPITVIGNNEKEIDKDIVDFFTRESEKLKRRYSDENISKQDISSTLWKYNFDQLIRSFVVNDFIKNVELTKLIAGDTIYQAHYKDYHKRAKGNISTGTITIVDNWFADHMKSREANTFSGSMGVVGVNDYKTTKTYNFKDDIRSSKYFDSKILQNDLKAVRPDLDEAGINTLLDKYSDLNVADGQGHVTLDFYRQFLISRGNWPITQEIAYQKELAWFRLNYSDLIPGYDENKRKSDQDYLIRNEKIIGYFPPMKVQYDGPIKTEGTYAPVMDKFSIAPLIPSVIKGKALEKVNLDLIKKGNVGYTKFESGTKKFKFTPVDLYQEVNGKKTFSPVLDSEPATHYLIYLKEQINTAFKVKEETRFGSQIRKLIMANLFSNGIGDEKSTKRLERYIDILNKFQVDKKYKLFKRIGIKQEGTGFKVVNMEKFISQIQFEAKRQGLNDNILDYIQYDKDSKTVVYPLETSLNRGPIQDLIMGMIDRELRIHKMNGDMAIQVASSGYEDADFNYTNPSDEDIKKYGTNGLSFYHLEYKDGKAIKTNKMQVKVSLTGSFKKLLNRTDVREMSESMRITKLEALNRLIKDSAWITANEKSITLVGYRIPTQGINSMENMIVQEFLPEQAGSIIIPPAEIVAKSGSDYDIDKLSIFKPSLSIDGEYISTEDNMKKIVNQKIDELENKIEALRKGSDYFNKSNVNVNKFISSLFGIEDHEITNLEQEEIDNLVKESTELQDIYSSYQTLQELEKGYLSNQIIELYDEILSDPDIFDQLITPNSTDLIKDETNSLAVALGKRKKEDLKKGKQGYLRTQIYRAVNNYRKFESLLEGKKFLGVFAVNNTLSQLFQQNNTRINTSYLHPWVKDSDGKKPFRMNVNLLLLSPEERKKVIENGKIKLGDKYNIEGKLKQEYISQLVNAAVDIASDDFIGYINLNWENIGPMTYLLHQGVPYDRAIWFLNQPVLQRYYEMLRKNSNSKPRDVQMDLYEELTGDSIPRNRISGKRNAQFFLRNMSYIENQVKSNYFDYNKMVDRVKKVGNKYNDFLYGSDNKDAKSQIYFFAHFIMLQEQAKQLRNFSSTINFDTTKVASPIDAFAKELNKESVARINLFDKEETDKITNNSVISIFNNNKLITDIFHQVMPSAYKEGFLNKAAELLNETYLSSKDRRKFTKLLINDFVEFLVKNFGIYNGKNISEIGANLLSGEKGRLSLARRAVYMKEKYPDLVDQFTLFKRIFPNFGNRKRKIDNIEIHRIFENTVDDQNRYIDEFRKLINFSDNRYTIEQQAEIQKFFKDLALLGFFQSGFNKSPISFQELVPHEQFSNLFRDAMYTFDYLSKEDPKLVDDLFQAFKQKFKQNNAKFFGKTGLPEAYRFKPYGIRNDLLVDKVNRIMQQQLKFEKNVLPKVEDIKKLIGYDEPAPETEVDEEETIGIVENIQQEKTISIQMQPDNIEKIKSGKKTITNRTYLVKNGTYQLPDGTPIDINLLGQYKVQGEKVVAVGQTKGLIEYSLNTFAKLEGFSGAVDFIENNKYSKNFINGKETRYVYSITLHKSTQNPAQVKIEENIEAETRTVEQVLENSPEDSLVKTQEEEKSKEFNEKNEAIKNADQKLIEKFTNDHATGLTYLQLPKGLSNKQIEDIHGEVFDIENQEYIDKYSKEVENYQDYLNALEQLNYYTIEQIGMGNDYGEATPSGWITQAINDVAEIDFDIKLESYNYRSLGQILEDYIKGRFDFDENLQNGIKNLLQSFNLLKFENYNPNQISLFDEETLKQIKKDNKDDLDNLTNSLNQKC
jgi:hypothetical protein